MADKPAKETPAAPAAASSKSGMGGLLPVLAVVVLVPALSFAMAEFLFFPKVERMLAESGALAAAKEAEAKKPEVKVVSSKVEPTFAYEFKDIVSNLAGSMKSRYIKVSFTAYSAAPDFTARVETNKAKLLDATLGVLASLALVDLEDPAVKNKVRNQLIFAYETVLRGRVVEEIYFSEFVVQ